MLAIVRLVLPSITSESVEKLYTPEIATRVPAAAAHTSCCSARARKPRGSAPRGGIEDVGKVEEAVTTATVMNDTISIDSTCMATIARHVPPVRERLRASLRESGEVQ